MFTGIIEEVGKVVSIKPGLKSSILWIQGAEIFDDLKLGDSVAVNGVCLTVSSLDNKIFTADIMRETLSRSSLAKLTGGSAVNLERAMPSTGRFGGHIVSGHIDGTGEVENIVREDNAIWFTINTSEKIMKYIVEKGSIAIDGTSLTVADLKKNSFRVSIIPHTGKSTILGTKRIGSIVNLENDIVGKYIEKLIFAQENAGKSRDGITMNMLEKAGF